MTLATDTTRLQEAKDLLNQSGLANLTMGTDANDQWHITGTVGGLPLPDIFLEIFKSGGGFKEDGLTSSELIDGQWRVTISLRSMYVLGPNIGINASILLHELWHGWCATGYPTFSKMCPKCEHQLVFARTAADLCAIANKCPPPTPPLDLSTRRDLIANSVNQNKLCKKLAAADFCSQCNVASKPTMVACMETDCELVECQ